MRHVLPMLVALAACSNDYPPCTPGDGAGGTTWVVSAAPSAASGGDWPADDDHGYSRSSDGEVCACDAADDAQRGCVDKPGEGPRLPTCGSAEDTGEGQCEGMPPGDPQSKHQCGEVFWCCYRVRCDDGHVSKLYDAPFCPGYYGHNKTRAGAWELWHWKIKQLILQLDMEHGLCWQQEGSCYEQAQGVCYNYPN